MTDGAPRVDPSAARSPAEYVALLRQVREQSGLSYRMIERKARAAGATLPPSTLATMLSRNVLPREESLTILLEACGAGPDEVARWVAARQRLDRAGAGPAPHTPPTAPTDADLTPSGGSPTSIAGDPAPLVREEPVRITGRPPLRFRIHPLKSLAAFAAFLAAGILTVVAMPGDQDAPTTRPAPPGACTTLRTADDEGLINICKTWTRHSDRKGYYGAYWGTILGRNVILEGYFDGRQQNITETGGRPSRDFSESFRDVERAYFRACRPQQACAGAWW